MKTIKIKKITTVSIIAFLLLFNSPAFSQGLPGDGTDNVDDEAPPAPIDQDIWLGLIVGFSIGAYFIVGKQRNTLLNK